MQLATMLFNKPDLGPDLPNVSRWHYRLDGHKV